MYYKIFSNYIHIIFKIYYKIIYTKMIIYENFYSITSTQGKIS